MLIRPLAEGSDQVLAAIYALNDGNHLLCALCQVRHLRNSCALCYLVEAAERVRRC